MAEENDQERTEEPTARRLQEAKDKGQVPRSKDLDALLMLLVSGAIFLFMGSQFVQGMMDIFVTSFTIDRSTIFNGMAGFAILQQQLTTGLIVVAPFFALMVLAALFVPTLLGGRTFSGEPLKLNFSKMDPVKGIKRVFGAQGLMELAKALGKFLAVSTVGAVMLYYMMPQFLRLSDLEAKQGIAYLGQEMLWLFIVVSSALAIVAAIDVPFQLWNHKRQLRMTRQQVKDEFKETEGNPEVRGKIRSKQMELSMRRMMEDVPKADVVVTNPTHYAVALRYDQGKMGAPIVVASGVDEIAGHIRRIAAANDVPILEAPPLARALYHSTDLGEEIPEGLYLAVAQVLAYVYQVKQYHTHGGLHPDAPGEFPIPDDLRQD